MDEIVLGDVISIEAGDSIPCDGLLIKSDLLSVDESTLTGEPMDGVEKNLVHKVERRNSSPSPLERIRNGESSRLIWRRSRIRLRSRRNWIPWHRLLVM